MWFVTPEDAAKAELLIEGKENFADPETGLLKEGAYEIKARFINCIDSEGKPYTIKIEYLDKTTTKTTVYDEYKSLSKGGKLVEMKGKAYSGEFKSEAEIKKALKEGKADTLFIHKMYKEEIADRLEQYRTQAEDLASQGQFGQAQFTAEKILMLEPEDPKALSILQKVLSHIDRTRSESL